MTDGGKIARRSARVFADEYHPAHEAAFTDGHGPVTHEKEEKQTLKEPRTRDSSGSSTSDDGFDLGLRAGTELSEKVRDGSTSLDLVRTSKGDGDGHPVNFGTVIPGVYRSGYPRTTDYKYLKALGLKTIVTLVGKDYPDGYQTFIQKNGINHVVFDMQGTKKVEIPKAIMNSVMAVLLDQRNYPLLVHCNQGKHRTGCVVAVIRKFMGWRVESIVEEYTGYAHPKSRETDISYIQSLETESLIRPLSKPSNTSISRVFHARAASRAKMMKILALVALVLGLWAVTAVRFQG